ncbi:MULTISPECIES: BLUF domain-containing protein [unclassified Paracoccus (in: a-proteobacteria)]|uniref:BLUF domain-containing protein n=1 Tax=unclassified Paracoccus (in: a-proteobacteria) TaxID=2688777 RepID=UPI0012B404F6|nr:MULTISPECIES: BLUF domain-containing protein [unclassified Paracoccus (in: a-proteobacteria)]UXU74610.1 BLUF domain-containing protein [Paracoccus sp. SMMA_5]UXU80504.1 BLUF domain-containing protein [Paracoccus sp. SMMA_5_TC]
MECAFLLYKSRTGVQPRSAECSDILASARRRNEELHLSGYLHLEDGQFYQWLEGPEAALNQVAALIEADPRHYDMTYLWRGTQPQRMFGDWHMGFGSADPGTLFDWVVRSGVTVGDVAGFARGLLGFMLAGARQQQG